MKRFIILSSAALSLAAVVLVIALFRLNGQSVQNPLGAAAFNGSHCTFDAENFQAAYQVNANVESEVNQQLLYKSDLTFKVQLQQALDARIFGKATEIQVTEAVSSQVSAASKTVDDVLFLTKAGNAEKLIFSDFDNLDLPAKHPLTILSQVVKNLSIGESGQDYSYAYDPLKRIYRYQLEPDTKLYTRTLVGDAAGQTPTAQMQTQWQVILDENCIPEQMVAEETSPFGTGTDGFIRFSIRAERIDDYENLLKTAYSPKANSLNRWQVATVQAGELTKDVTSDGEMWSAFSSFSSTKDTGLLVNATDYLIDTVSPLDLAEMITLKAGDVLWRDMLFGFSLSHHAEVENYMLDLLDALPDNAGDAIDLQKVRLMVSLSSNDQVSDNAFQALLTLVDDHRESDNVRRNALISMGTVVQQMSNQAQDVSVSIQQLSEEIVQKLQSAKAYAAIYAAGNAGLENLDNEVEKQVVSKLESANERERFASATVLVRNPERYDLLLNHLTSETSALVSSAIVFGLDDDKLSSDQYGVLQTIASNTTEQIREQIHKLLGN